VLEHELGLTLTLELGRELEQEQELRLTLTLELGRELEQELELGLGLDLHPSISTKMLWFLHSKTGVGQPAIRSPKPLP